MDDPFGFDPTDFNVDDLAEVSQYHHVIIEITKRLYHNHHFNFAACKGCICRHKNVSL